MTVDVETGPHVDNDPDDPDDPKDPEDPCCANDFACGCGDGTTG